ncbi:MAG: efflux RND transporter periplasmic adaptor subunit [Planctomycetota bacterium]|nr:MAG: efflux RND transporter periplasmic adaptor subunit [Planctomycetota bacterium]
MNKASLGLLVWIGSVLVAGWMISHLFGANGEGGAAVPVEDGAGGSNESEEAEEPAIWTCSMDPQVRLPEPGQCPICFMDLIQLQSKSSDLGPRTFSMTPGAMALAEIETAPVVRRPVAHELRMIGKVAYDETRMATITAWVAGRLERLYVDYTGVSVRKGDHLVDLYSPELYSAQQELHQALATAAKLQSSPIQALKESAEETVIAARSKLRLLGLAADQIDAIEQSGELKEHLTIRAPIGGVVIHKNALEGLYVQEGSPIYTIVDLQKVWVKLEAYEGDLAWLRYGQDVAFEVEAFPGEVFHGRIAFIDPVLNDETRTVRVRVNVDNADLRLKPAMFVSATVQAVLTPHGKAVDPDLAGQWMCPMHPEIVAGSFDLCSECGMDLVPASDLGFVAHEPEDKDLPLVIPATAPLLTGRRAVVYVRLPNQEQPTFQGKVVQLGPRAGDWYVVREGLKEGEQVVVQGAFKLDSELQLQARPSMMNPDSEPKEKSEEIARFDAPDSFQEALGALALSSLPLQQELAADHWPAASRAEEQLHNVLDSISDLVLSSEAQQQWRRQKREMEKALAALEQAGNLEAGRSAFGDFQQALLAALGSFPWRPDREFQVVHCPMAFDNQGAAWLQAGEQIQNPYFGASMLRCGKITERFSSETEQDDELRLLRDGYLTIQNHFRAEAWEAMEDACADLIDELKSLDGKSFSFKAKRESLLEAAKRLFFTEDLEARQVAFSELEVLVLPLIEGSPAAERNELDPANSKGVRQ